MSGKRLDRIGLRFLVLMIGLWLVGTSLAICQEEKKADAVPAAAAAAVKTDPPPAAEEKPSAVERLIYLPYRNLKEVFEQQGSTVFMPYAEYLKQFGQPKPTDKKVVDAVITEAHYVGRVDRSMLRVNAKLTVRVLGKPWVEVPVKFGAAAVGKLTASKEGDVLLKGTGNGTYALLFGSVGEHVVELELAAPIQTSPDGRRADFEVPPVAVTTFELAVPEADQTIDLVPKVVALPVESQAKETRIKANLGSTTSVSATWHPKTSAKPEMDLLTAVTNLQRVTFRDGLVHTSAWLTYEILRGEMTEVLIVVPAGQRVLGVTSNDAKIRAWKAEAGAKQQVVRVEFLNPATGRITIEVNAEREFGTEPVAVLGKPDDATTFGIHAKSAVRESGQVVVTSTQDLTLSLEPTPGVSRIDDAEIDAKLKVPNASAFKFFNAATKLSVTAKQAEPRLVVDGAYYAFEIHDDEIRMTATLPYQVDRAGVFEVKLALPNNLVIDEVHCFDQQGRELVREFHVEGESPRVLRVPFLSKSAATAHLNCTVRGHLKFAEATEMVELTMPLPEPQGLERETGTVVVSAAESVEVITDPKTVVGAQPIPVPDMTARQPGTGLRVASMYSFNRRPVTIPVKTVRKPTRLSAAVATTINIKEETTEVVSEVRYLVEYAGLDTFRFSVPEEIAGDLQITSLEAAPLPGIKQQVKAEKSENGWLTRTVTLHREVTGTYRFRLAYDVKPKEIGEGKAADKAKQSLVQIVRVLDLDGSDAKKREVALAAVSGEIVIDKTRALAINAKKMDDALEPMDVRELSLLPQSGAQAYRYFRQPVAVLVEARKFDIQEVVETVVMRGLVEMVTRKDVNAAYRCRYWLKSSERQRLRVDVPIGSEVLGVFVDGKQVSPERNNQMRDELQKAEWDSYFVNVARSKQSDEPFSISLQMQAPIGEGTREPYEARAGALMLRLPQVGGVQAGGVALQQMQVVIWAPDRFDLVGEPERFVRESKLSLIDALFTPKYRPYDAFDCDSWVNVPVFGIIDFPTEGHRYRLSNMGGAQSVTVTFASRSFYRWLLCGALIAIALLLRGISWENKLLLLLLAGAVAALFGLSQPGWVAEIVGVSRLGLLAVAAIWILHGLFALRLAQPAIDSHPSSETRVRIAAGTGVPAAVPPPGVFDDLRKDFGVK